MLHYENLYWFFKSALCDNDINRIIKLAKKQNKKLGRIGSFPERKFKAKALIESLQEKTI